MDIMTSQKTTQIAVGPLMRYKGVTVQKVAQEQGLAYNTVLGYRRASSERVNLDVMEKIAESLGVELWQLFYLGQWARPLMKIAQAAGATRKMPPFKAGIPVTDAEYKALFQAIAKAVGVALEDSDFLPIEFPEAEEEEEEAEGED